MHPQSAGKSLTKHLLKFYRPLRHPTKMAQKKGLGPPTFCCGRERSSTGAKSLRNTRPQGGCKNPRFSLRHYAKFFRKKNFFFNYAEIFAGSAGLGPPHPVKSCLRPIEKNFIFYKNFILQIFVENFSSRVEDVLKYFLTKSSLSSPT